MLNIVLVEPEIPQNAGNIARTCACIGARLHLIEPMGFRMTAKTFARAGCDYWDKVELIKWNCVQDFREAHGDDELHLFSGAGSSLYTDVTYGSEAFLVFGRESRGLDPEWLEAEPERVCRIPMKEGLRSLNLSNAVAIGAYEALRQQGFPGLIT